VCYRLLVYGGLPVIQVQWMDRLLVRELSMMG